MVEVGHEVDEFFLVQCHHLVGQLWLDQVKVISFLKERKVRFVIHKEEFCFFDDPVEVVGVRVKFRAARVLCDDHFCQRRSSFGVQIDPEFSVMFSGRYVNLAGFRIGWRRV